MKKTFGILSILIAISGRLSTAEAQPLPIRLSYAALTGAMLPLWMAKELDLFERHGVQSSPIYMAATIAYQAMLAGETDFTIGGSVPSIQARLGGADTLILVTYSTAFAFSFLAQLPIQQPSDLRGKRIGITRFGTPPDFAARIALKGWHLVPVKDVAIVQFGGQPETFAALKAGSVQGAVLGTPFSTEAKRQGMVELIDFSQTDTEFAAAVLMSTARYVSARDEATRRLIRALVEGIWAFKSNREGSLRALEKYARLTDRNVLEETYQINRKVLRLVPRTTVAAVRNVLEALADQNPRARGGNPQEFYSNRFIDELEQTGFMRELAARYPGALR